MNRWLNDILNVFFPAVCHVCNSPLGPDERFVCTKCLSSLPRTGYHRVKMNPMEERFAGHFPFSKATGHFFYSRDSSLAILIQDMKYRNFPSIGRMLGEVAGKELYTTGFLSDIDCIVPVPMHFYKQALRGYNQTDKIAEGISIATDIPVSDILRMTRRRKTQTALSRAQRIANANELFKPKKEQDLNGKGVLVVDDVCTTGATIGAAAKAITDRWPQCRVTLFSLGVTF